MQFTTFLSVFVFVATALAAPAQVPDPSIKTDPSTQADPSTEAQAGDPTWEFRPFSDASCQNSPQDVLSGPQTPGSQCINITERFGTGVNAAQSAQGCKSKFPSPRPT